MRKRGTHRGDSQEPENRLVQGRHAGESPAMAQFEVLHLGRATGMSVEDLNAQLNPDWWLKHQAKVAETDKKIIDLR